MISCRPVLVKDLAAELGSNWEGAQDQLIDNVATIESANKHSIVFLANQLYRKFLATTDAGCILTSKTLSATKPEKTIACPQVYMAWIKTLAFLFPDKKVESDGFVSPYAVIHPSAKIGKNVHIGPYVMVGAHAKIGDASIIKANSTIQDRVVIGQNCRIDSGCHLEADTILENDVVLQNGVVLGANGFGYTQDQGRSYAIPQLGKLRIGSHVFIGANSCIARGSINDTVIEDYVCIDNLVQIAHNVTIGQGTMIAAQTGIAGSTTIGKYCQFGGQVGVAGHIHIADGCIFCGRSVITHDVNSKGIYSAGTGMFEVRKWRRMVAKLRQLVDNDR